jgi:hypothetical protein
VSPVTDGSALAPPSSEKDTDWPPRSLNVTPVDRDSGRTKEKLFEAFS